MPYGLQEKLCHLKSTCIQAKQLQYNNNHYILMIFIFLHIRRFCVSKGGSVPLPSDMRGSTVFAVIFTKLYVGVKYLGCLHRPAVTEVHLC